MEQRKGLPKLETQGFVTRESVRPTIKDKASGAVRRIGIERKAPAAKEEELDLAYKRLLAKTGVCAAVAITILIISTVSAPVSTGVKDAVDYVVNHQFDIDEDIGRLKFVEALDETESVFSPLPDTMAVYPADGTVVTAFGADGSSGVRMSAKKDSILSIAKGTVDAVGQIDAQGYVKVKLDTGEHVTYYHIAPKVQVADIVLPGQEIGTLTDEYLYVEMKQGNEFLDPVAYIKERVGTSLQ